ncbi:hypothetical protein B0H15DRAFT_958853 [Mycena belliarum]|uniref:Uncharacterized protein n=1 Tax=Mycena belliarum TaxID=1033014 RepID=A0AAD6TKC0_9AGAR|nr:hypothetical protein B0H15DRAFT_958853 [Mycena belliae]
MSSLPSPARSNYDMCSAHVVPPLPHRVAGYPASAPIYHAMRPHAFPWINTAQHVPCVSTNGAGPQRLAHPPSQPLTPLPPPTRPPRPQPPARRAARTDSPANPRPRCARGSRVAAPACPYHLASARPSHSPQTHVIVPSPNHTAAAAHLPAALHGSCTRNAASASPRIGLARFRADAACAKKDKEQVLPARAVIHISSYAADVEAGGETGGGRRGAAARRRGRRSGSPAPARCFCPPAARAWTLHSASSPRAVPSRSPHGVRAVLRVVTWYPPARSKAALAQRIRLCRFADAHTTYSFTTGVASSPSTSPSVTPTVPLRPLSQVPPAPEIHRSRAAADARDCSHPRKCRCCASSTSPCSPCRKSTSPCTFRLRVRAALRSRVHRPLTHPLRRRSARKSPRSDLLSAPPKFIRALPSSIFSSLRTHNACVVLRRPYSRARIFCSLPAAPGDAARVVSPATPGPICSGLDVPAAFVSTGAPVPLAGRRRRRVSTVCATIYEGNTQRSNILRRRKSISRGLRTTPSSPSSPSRRHSRSRSSLLPPRRRPTLVPRSALQRRRSPRPLR